MNQINSVLILITAITLFNSISEVNQVYAVDRFMSLTGKDTGNCSVEQSPCLTLQYSMMQLKSGDTLLIDDGNYTDTADTIDSYHWPPSGSDAAHMTIVRAKNIPGLNGVSENQPLKVKFTGNAKFYGVDSPVSNPHPLPMQYIKFWGIRWNGINTYVNWNNLYFKQCASQGIGDFNDATIVIGGKNTLLEDIVAFGKGRYKIEFYDYSRESQSYGDANNLCRRCIARQDWANGADPIPPNNGPTQPIAGIVSYYTRGSAFLNNIVIDSDDPTKWYYNTGSTAELSGSFYQAVDGGNHRLTVQGSMVINSAEGAIHFEQGSTGNIVKDFVAIKTGGGIGLDATTSYDGVTLFNVNADNFTWRDITQKNRVLDINTGGSNWRTDRTPSVVNSVFSTINGRAFDATSSATNDYMNIYGALSGNYTNGIQAASHLLTSNPMTTGLMYPVRIEAGSPLYSAGSSGNQVGAKIINKLGVDGTFKGDLNWDTEQVNSPLWPWPLEGWIQAEMRSMDASINGDSMPNPNRGFCANKQTLTNYIWGYLGNTVPPFNLTATPASINTIDLTWAPNTANDNLTGYKVYVGTSPGNYNFAGYVSGKNVELATSETLTGLHPTTLYYVAVTAVDGVKGESGYSYEIITTPNDTTAPTYSAFDLPPIINSLTVNFTSFSATDNIGVTGYMVTESSTAPAATDAGWVASAPTSYTFAAGTVDGTKILYAWAKDAAGNVSKSKNAPVTIDLTPPTITVTQITSPTDLTSQILSGTINDNLPGSSVTVKVGSSTAASAAINGTTWSYALSGLSVGANSITVTAQDAAGNKTTTAATIVVNLVAPTLSINAVASPTNITTQNLSGTVTSSVAINSVTVQIGSGAPAAATISGTAWSYSLSGLTAGPNTITVTAQDSTGYTISKTVTIVVDQTAPSVSINTVSSPTIFPAQTLNGTVSDNIAVGSVMVQIGSGVAAAASINGTTWSYQASGLSTGANTITITALDTAGNTASTVTTIIVNNVGGSGLFSINDALNAIQFAVGNKNPTPSELSLYDVAPLDMTSHKSVPDGKIDIDDVILILRQAVGLGW